MFRPRLTLIAQQFLGGLRHQLRPLARSAFKEKQTLAEHEAIEQERLRVRFLRRQAGRAIEMPDILQPRRIDAGDRAGGNLVGPGPLPDRQFDRHVLGIHAPGIELDQRLQPLARGGAIKAGMFFDGRDAAAASSDRAHCRIASSTAMPSVFMRSE